MVDLAPIPLADGDDEAEVLAAPAPVMRASRARTGFSPAVSLHLLAPYGDLRTGHPSRPCHLVGARGPGRPHERLAAVARRSSPLLPQRAITRAFLGQSGTTAGYDPSFMAGYPKSVIFPASSTLPELIVWAFGGDNPALAYKVYVLVSAAAIPWLVILAAAVSGVRPFGQAACVFLYLLYVWTDFPINYAAFGMLPYLLAIPLGLLATAAFARYLNEGGLALWLVSAGLMSLCVLVHPTAAMVVAPRPRWATRRLCLVGPRIGHDKAWRQPGPARWQARQAELRSRGLAISASGSSRSSSWPRTHSGGCREPGWRRPRARATSPSATRGRASWHDWCRSSPPRQPSRA